MWNADGTGEPLILAGHEDNVRSAAFSPDGTRIVTGSGDGTAWVWLISGPSLQELIRKLTSVCLNPDFRQKHLGELPKSALRKYEECERSHERMPKARATP